MIPAAPRGALRVALVSDWYLPRRGGVELHLADLRSRLTAAGHHADVITTLPDVDGDGDAGVVRLGVTRLPGAGIACTPGLVPALARALRDGRYDVAHCHASVASPAAWTGAWVARRLGLPCVVTCHSVLYALRAALAASDRVGAWARGPVRLSGVSALVASQLRRALPAARVSVLPNGVDLAWWRDVPPAVAARGGGALVVAAMRLAPKKRPEVLVAVAERLAADAAAAGAPAPRVVLAGDGPARGAVERLARRRGVAGVLELPGWVPRERLRAMYAAADCFVLPTEREAFGIAALEARAAGLPVVARRGTGVEDFVRPGRDGLLAGSDAALVDAVACVVGDGALRERLAAGGRADPPAAYDWSRIVAAHEALYAEAGAPA